MQAENSVACPDDDDSSDEDGPGANSLSPATAEKPPGNAKKKKTFGIDVKGGLGKLSFLRRRHTDTSLSSKMDGEQKKITAQDLKQWAKNIDNLLKDRNGLDLFREFLRTEFSDENLEFWIACEEFRCMKSSKIPSQANKIYADFVTIQASREINLDAKTRDLIKENMVSPNKRTFEEAQRKIIGLMEKDSYPRFLNSEPFQKLLKDHKVTS